MKFKIGNQTYELFLVDDSKIVDVVCDGVLVNIFGPQTLEYAMACRIQQLESDMKLIEQKLDEAAGYIELINSTIGEIKSNSIHAEKEAMLFKDAISILSDVKECDNGNLAINGRIVNLFDKMGIK